MKGRRKNRTALTFCAQMLVLAAVLMGVCVVLIQIYAAAGRISAQARATNDAVQIAANAAEAFQKDGTLETMAALLGDETVSEGAQSCTLYLDRGLMCTGSEEGEYTLTARRTQTAAPAGTLAEVALTVVRGEETVYTLTAQTYLPDGSGGGA